jgi:hypothetical protein
MKDVKDEKHRAKQPQERQLEGGTDLDTTSLDGPSDLSRSGGDQIETKKHEHGPLTVVPAEEEMSAPMDPTADDPFVPGTGEAKDDFDPDSLLSDREKRTIKEVHKKDSKGENGPTYEAHQGTADQTKGGSTDPNNSLTEDTSGLQVEPD